MNVLFVAGWSTSFGDFIKEHCKSISDFAEVHYVYIEFIKSPRHIPYKIVHHEEILENITFHNIEIHCYLRRFGSFDRLVQKAYKKVIKKASKRKPLDICHINVLTPVTENIFRIKRLKNVPFVLTEHSSYYHTGIYQKFDGALLRREKSRISTLLKSTQIKAILPVSEQLGEVLRSDFKAPAQKIFKIPNVATEDFSYRPKVKTGTFNFCLIAIWSPPKNPLLFLESLLELDPDIRSKINITWIGDGEQMDSIRNFHRQHLGDVKIDFTGIVREKEKIAAYLQQADFLVHPSNAENLPCVIIESLCCGTPVLSNAINGITELVNEFNGILTPPGDVKAFATSLKTVIAGHKQFDHQAIALNAQQLYYPKKIGEQIAGVYNAILNQNFIFHNWSCSRCILDSKDDPQIEIDENGICNYCRTYDVLSRTRYFQKENQEQKFAELINEIKSNKGKNRYDCILGVSGGIDSCYTAIHLVANGLNPLIVHLDNGWNSEKAVQNIENLVKQLNLDLHTHVIDWEEFKDIQLSFLKASVVDIELVTDYAIVACLYNLAAQMGITHIVTGHNYATESIMPRGWTHAKSDLKNILSIHRKFGSKKIRTFPTMGYFKKSYYVQFKKIKVVPYLNYIHYNKAEAKELLVNDHGWKDYGGKHSESIFTKFYQNYILPRKFGIDKRKAHLSSLICSGQISREEAIREIKKPVYDEKELQQDKEYVMKKFNLTEEEFEQIMNMPINQHTDFGTYVNTHYKYEVWLSRNLKPISRPIKKLLGIRVKNNYV